MVAALLSSAAFFVSCCFLSSAVFFCFLLFPDHLVPSAALNIWWQTVLAADGRGVRPMHSVAQAAFGLEADGILCKLHEIAGSIWAKASLRAWVQHLEDFKIIQPFL